MVTLQLNDDQLYALRFAIDHAIENVPNVISEAILQHDDETVHFAAFIIKQLQTLHPQVNK